MAASTFLRQRSLTFLSSPVASTFRQAVTRPAAGSNSGSRGCYRLASSPLSTRTIEASRLPSRQALLCNSLSPLWGIHSTKLAQLPKRQVRLVARESSAAQELPSKLYAASELKGSKAPLVAADEADDDVEAEPTEQVKFVSEFVVTALFNFLSCTAVATAQQVGTTGLQTTLMVMGAHGIILPLLIYTFMPISGAHFNPMVTWSMVVAGKQSVLSGISYTVAQCLGGIIGAFAAWNSLPSKLQTYSILGAQAVPEGHTVLQAFVEEGFAACFFLFVLFGTLVDKRGWGKLGPLSVPLAVMLLIWLVGPVSSMCINPARALGPAIVSGYWENHWIWWTAPFLGGATASLTYSRVFAPKTGGKIKWQ